MKHYKFCLWKAYFERGYSLTAYIKYLIIIGGLYEGFTTQTLRATIITALVYGVACFFIGWVWYKFGFVEAENEVNNRFNLFQKEVRKKLK